MSAPSRADSIGPRQLRVLIALAEEGTFTDAAIRLGMSQPAVSRALGRLEQTLGVRLVQRTTRSLTLTSAGRACAQAAATALLAIDAVVQAAQGRPVPLRLGYAWAAFGQYTNAILRGWREQYPHVPLEIHRVDERDAGLARGLVDVAVQRGPVDEPGLAVERIFEEGRLAAVPAGSRLADRTSLSLADLSAEQIALAPLAGTTTLDLWPSAARPVRTIQVTNTDEWLIAIASGEAVGVTAESTAFQHPHPGMQFIRLQDVPAIAVSLVWRNSGSPPAHSALSDFISLVHRCVAAGQA
jgi:DNA-binding transcriptional LysR family regulator